MRLILLLMLITFCAPACATSNFTDEDRAGLVTFWNTPGRYMVGRPPGTSAAAGWREQLTPEASRWFLAYNAALGQAKAPPTLDAEANSTSAVAWETWVKQRLAADRLAAQALADSLNATANAHSSPLPVPAPPVPSPIPTDLLAAVGNPPPFAAAVHPLQYVVTFEDGDHYSFSDNVPVRSRFAYYRWPQGTAVYGRKLAEIPTPELASLFALAGMTPSEGRIATAVSRLEGGFEAINTYDTGYISVGFIQFIAGEGGRGSLSSVLAREKARWPLDFEADFRHFGVDVDESHTLIVVDPNTGAELAGAPAVMKVIDDKRLTAVFERAGKQSQTFRAAQVQIARDSYWPSNDAFTAAVDGHALTGKVSDIVRSEAGIATLFDRKVNRGNIRPFPDVVGEVMQEHHLLSFADAQPYEREIIAKLKYRANFLRDPNLSQPLPAEHGELSTVKP